MYPGNTVTTSDGNLSSSTNALRESEPPVQTRLRSLLSQNNEAQFVSPSAIAASAVAQTGADILQVINNLPPLAESTPQQVRAERTARGNPWDHQNPQDVLRRDISIPLPTGQLPARIYLPAINEDFPLPALVYYHGGGFVIGDIPSYDKPLAQLARLSGCAVVSVEYRLAPEHRFPAAVEDARNAFNWLSTNAEHLGLNSNCLAIGGDSAGANLAAVTCLLNRDQADPQPALQLLIYPCTAGNEQTASRQQFSEDLLLTSAAMQWFHDHYIPAAEARDWRFCVLNAQDLRNLPPALVLTAGFDPLRDEGAEYAYKLRANGNVARHSCYTDMFHGFINFGVLPQARAALEECATVLREMRLATKIDESEPLSG